MAAPLQHGQGAGRGCCRRRARLVQGVADPGLGADGWITRLELLPGEQLGHGGAIGEIEALEAKNRAGAEPREARLPGSPRSSR